MTDTEIDRAIDDARQMNEELFISDDNGEVFKNLTSFLNTGEENNFENSELDLASNLSSSTELEADIKHEVETRRERLKSALYVRLKRRKVFQIVKGVPFRLFQTQFVAKYQNR